MPEREFDVATYLDALHQEGTGALAPLFDHYRPKLTRVVSLYMQRELRGRVEVADVLQEAFLDANQRISSYLSQREVEFYVWLRRITLNRLSKFHRFHLRTQRRAVSRELALPDRSSLLLGQQLVSRGSSPSQHLRTQELRERVQRAIQALPEGDREIILMRNFEELSNQEVAQSLGLNESTATMRYGRAVARLRTTLLGDNTVGGSSS